jgi:hypothetical protein
MNLKFHSTIPTHFSDDSRLWIYQSNRILELNEVLAIEELLKGFTTNWKSHGDDVMGFGTVLFAHFVILMADERQSGVSGCSTDTSVRLMKNIEQDLGIDLFNRQNLAFVVNEKIQMVPLSQFQNAIENDIISPDNLYFNNTVQTKKELEQNWIVPIKKSWLAKKLAVNK